MTNSVLHLTPDVAELELPHSAVELELGHGEREIDLSEACELPRVRRWPMLVAGLTILVIIGGIVGYYQLWTAQGQRSAGNDLTIALYGAPPAVEPLILKQVSMDYAREVNAATPFTTEPVPPAPPFKFSGTQIDYNRAVDCLASTIYYEAGNEAIEGQKAVVQVVLNRARHPAFPNSICGVVFQGQERRTGCQFSYTCDGSIIRRRPTQEAWASAQAIARSMMNGEVYAPVGLATHYHTDWVLPAWSAKLDKIRAERTHLFFRWTGFWGTPKAFRIPYMGAEMPNAALAALSPAHVGPADNGLAGIDLTQDLARDLGLTIGPEVTTSTLGSNTLSTGEPGLQPPTITTNAPPAPAATVASDAQKGQFVMKADADADPMGLLAMAEKTCGARDYCRVMVWVDPSKTPKSLAIDESQRAALSFSYLRDRAKSFEKPLWNCKDFSRPDKRNCIQGTGHSSPKPAVTKPGKPGKARELLSLPDDVRQAATTEGSTQ